MFVKRNYSFWMTFNWSKTPFIAGFIYASIILFISHYFGIDITVPWQPISLIGIAVAFYLGFKNNSSYDRTWEARKIWGSIVNNSRTFGAAVVSFVQGKDAEIIKKELIYRHIAWLIVLRYQLRLSKPWEHEKERLTKKFIGSVCSEYHNTLDGELSLYLSNDEIIKLEEKSNMATQILKNQSVRLQELRDQENFEDFRHIALHELIQTFYEDQGKSERIKNFPFPRQYASTALWLTYVFCALVPFGLIEIFTLKDSWLVYAFPFMSALVTWIFFLMEKIGDYSENPFEGSYNDVPITNISEVIAQDLREMIDDTDITKPSPAENGFLL